MDCKFASIGNDCMLSYDFDHVFECIGCNICPKYEIKIEQERKQ